MPTLLKALLPAFRLRTLPLAFSSILVGTALSVANGNDFQPIIFILTLLTAFSLQILSNIANDYGDGVKGTDSRQIQAQPNGLTPRVVANDNLLIVAMRKLLIIWSLVSMTLGLALLVVAIDSLRDFLVFLALGLLSIIASITYTVGKKAYGYHGLGDLSVFVFFGLVGVLGSYYLQTHQFNVMIIFPAMAVGLFCVSVLNINNLRDLETDKQSGKHTFALFLGKQKAKHYHAMLISVAFMGLVLGIEQGDWFTYGFLLTLPLFFAQIRRIYRAETAEELACELPLCVKLILVCCVAYGLGLVVGGVF